MRGCEGRQGRGDVLTWRCVRQVVRHFALGQTCLKKEKYPRDVPQQQQQQQKATIPNNTRPSPTVSPPCVTGGFNGRFPAAKRLTGDSMFKGGGGGAVNPLKLILLLKND